METSEQRTEQSKRQNSISKTGDQFERMFSKLMKSEPEETQYRPTEVKGRNLYRGDFQRNLSKTIPPW